MVSAMKAAPEGQRRFLSEEKCFFWIFFAVPLSLPMGAKRRRRALATTRRPNFSGLRMSGAVGGFKKRASVTASKAPSRTTAAPSCSSFCAFSFCSWSMGTARIGTPKRRASAQSVQAQSVTRHLTFGCAKSDGRLSVWSVVASQLSRWFVLATSSSSSPGWMASLKRAGFETRQRTPTEARVAVASLALLRPSNSARVPAGVSPVSSSVPTWTRITSSCSFNRGCEAGTTFFGPK
mmetsp:Transcript_9242/g.30038  ORF Transcript_9242/g.30038 Transcript_9242/m.30038 type:complete len:236 (-) Transcript_9242:838-1545(-)